MEVMLVGRRLLFNVAEYSIVCCVGEVFGTIAHYVCLSDVICMHHCLFICLPVCRPASVYSFNHSEITCVYTVLSYEHWPGVC